MALTDPGKGLSVMIFGNAVPKGTANVAIWAGAIVAGPDSGTTPANKIPLANSAAGGGQRDARFVAGSAAVAGGEIELAPMAVVSGYTGGTPGAPVYVDPAAPGKLTETIPVTSGQCKKQVGYILPDGTSVFLAPALMDLTDPNV